jgi:hypothetical protein
MGGRLDLIVGLALPAVVSRQVPGSLVFLDGRA